MNFRRMLVTPQARRCSTAAVATAAAALMLTPATAFAGDHPAGPGRPANVGHEHGHEHGGAGHGGTGHSATGHSGHKNGRKSGKKPGHMSGHPTRQSSGHSTGHSTEHSTGPSRAAGAHHLTGATHRSAADSGPGSSGADRMPPASDASKSTSAGGSKAPKSDTKNSPESGPMATVIKLSMSKNLVSTRPLTMSARVSPAHRTVGAPRETGTVTFTVDGATSGPVTVANNRASAKVKLSPGRHTAAATYSGDSSHSPSESGPLSFTVN